MSLNKIFDEFNNLYGIKTKDIQHDQESMCSLIDDEFSEMLDETISRQVNHHDFVKEAIDLVYITCQQLRERGVNLDSALGEVHRSNMSKSVEASNVVEQLEIARERYPHAMDTTNDCEVFVLKCEKTGKVIRPTTYSPTVITNEMIGR